MVGLSKQILQGAGAATGWSNARAFWIAQGWQRIPRGSQLEPAGNRRRLVGLGRDPRPDGAAQAGKPIPPSAKNGVHWNAFGRHRARLQQSVDGDFELQQLAGG